MPPERNDGYGVVVVLENLTQCVVVTSFVGHHHVDFALVALEQLQPKPTLMLLAPTEHEPKGIA